MIPEKGLLAFIKTKLENGIPFTDIQNLLAKTGIPDQKINEAYEYIKKNDKEAHQDLTAMNDFLPALKTREQTVKERTEKEENADLRFYPPESQKGLFNGRLRRKDFILGFLFFFALGYVALTMTAVLVSSYFPRLWSTLLDTIQSDTDRILTMGIPVILLPITIMMMSLIARRLHNLGLSGGLSFLFLVIFAPPLGDLHYGIQALDVSLFILFVVLLTVKGSPAVNIYGPLPPSKGSFFKRIFNQ